MLANAVKSYMRTNRICYVDLEGITITLKFKLEISSIVENAISKQVLKKLDKIY